jgi:prepilin-type N-terminal cleavage/methylation domain-containing protein
MPGGGNLMKKDAGFSLIELVVVIAIMAILGSGVFISVFSSSAYRARQAAREIDSVLTETRVQALSKEGAWMEIDCVDTAKKKYVIKTSYSEDITVGGGITITYEVAGSSGTKSITGNDITANALALSYNRSTGGFTPMLIATAEDGTYTSGSDYCSKITITGGSRTYVINLSRNTGRHTLVD